MLRLLISNCKTLTRLERFEAWTRELTKTRTISTFPKQPLPQEANTLSERLTETDATPGRFLACKRTVTATGQPRRFFTTGAALQKQSGPEVDEDWVPLAKGDKVLKVRLSTTRVDAILKAGLQISKNKITKAFYEDRIRINGERPKKKSQQLGEGDEVDIIRGQNKVNPEFLDVARVEIVTLNEEGAGHNQEEEEYSSDDEETSDAKIPAVLKRYKSLTIENYNESWKGGVESS